MRPVEQVGDKGGLAADIMTVNLSNLPLPLPHHRHGLETRQRLPRRTETAEAEPRPHKALDTPVVLLDGCGAKIGSKAYLTTQQLWDESGRHVKLG